MPLKIPLKSAGARRVKVSLGENLVMVRTYFNRILNYWVMDLFTDDGVGIASGLNMVAGINMLEWSKRLTNEYGQFRVTGEAMGETALDEISLIWFSPGEFEAQEDPFEVYSPPLNYDFDALFPVVVVL